MSKFLKLIKNEKGATAIEYGLIAALIAVAAIGAMTNIGHEVEQHVPERVDQPQVRLYRSKTAGGGAERCRRLLFRSISECPLSTHCGH